MCGTTLSLAATEWQCAAVRADLRRTPQLLLGEESSHEMCEAALPNAYSSASHELRARVAWVRLHEITHVPAKIMTPPLVLRLSSFPARSLSLHSYSVLHDWSEHVIEEETAHLSAIVGMVRRSPFKPGRGFLESPRQPVWGSMQVSRKLPAPLG